VPDRVDYAAVKAAWDRIDRELKENAMPDFETMPIGTRKAISVAAELLKGLVPLLTEENYPHSSAQCENIAARLEALLEQARSDQGERDHNGGYTLDETEGHRRFEAARTEPIGFEPPEQDEAFTPRLPRPIGPKGIRTAPLDGC
jgi:hypothetical protein